MQTGMDVPLCPYFPSSNWALVLFPPAPSIILRAPPNRRGCHTISFPFLKVFSLYLSISPHASLCLFFPSFSPSFFCGKRIALVPIILTAAKFERLQPKNGETASIFSCTIHWSMSGAGHCMSRHRKCSLSCQYSTMHTKCQTGYPWPFIDLSFEYVMMT